MTLGQGLWESIKGVRGYKLFVTDPSAGQIALYTVVDGAERPGLLTLRMVVIGSLDVLYVLIALEVFDIWESGAGLLVSEHEAAKIAGEPLDADSDCREVEVGASEVVGVAP